MDIKSEVQNAEGVIQAEVGFIRSNWGKLAIVIVIAFVAGAAVGHFL